MIACMTMTGVVLMMTAAAGGIRIILQPVFQECLYGFVTGSLNATVEGDTSLLQGITRSRSHNASEEYVSTEINEPLGQRFEADTDGGNDLAPRYDLAFYCIKPERVCPPKLLENAAVGIGYGKFAICQHMNSSLI